MDHFELVSEYKPMGDQPQAIDKIAGGFLDGKKAMTLLGVTGSGKTFTMANVIAKLNKPTLIISHNKTLAAQLHGEMKAYFPNNAVEYFVDHYGLDIETRRNTENTFIAKVPATLSPTFYGWVFQFAGQMKIISPDIAVEQLKTMAKNFT